MRKHIYLGILTVSIFYLINNVYASIDKAHPNANAETKKQASYINKDIIAGSWKQLKGKIQQKWAKLTDDDVLKMKGTATELEGILQQKYGYTKQEVEKSIQEFLEENKANLTQDDKK